MRCPAFTVLWPALGASLVIASIASLAIAQTAGNPFRRAEAEAANRADNPRVASADEASADEAPPLSDQQRQVADELRLLKRAESRMGAKHPAVQDVRKKIADLTEQLEGMAAVSSQQKNQARPTQSLSIADMNDQQLRQLILRMAIKIEQLETRIETLERQRMVH